MTWFLTTTTKIIWDKNRPGLNGIKNKSDRERLLSSETLKHYAEEFASLQEAKHRNGPGVT